MPNVQRERTERARPLRTGDDRRQRRALRAAGTNCPLASALSRAPPPGAVGGFGGCRGPGALRVPGSRLAAAGRRRTSGPASAKFVSARARSGHRIRARTRREIRGVFPVVFRGNSVRRRASAALASCDQASPSCQGLTGSPARKRSQLGAPAGSAPADRAAVLASLAGRLRGTQVVSGGAGGDQSNEGAGGFCRFQNAPSGAGGRRGGRGGLRTVPTVLPLAACAGAAPKLANRCSTLACNMRRRARQEGSQTRPRIHRVSSGPAARPFREGRGRFMLQGKEGEGGLRWKRSEKRSVRAWATLCCMLQWAS